MFSRRMTSKLKKSVSNPKAPSKKALMKARMERMKARQTKRSSAMIKDGYPRNFLVDLPEMTKYVTSDAEFSLSFTASSHPSWNREVSDFVFNLTKENMESVYAESGDPQWFWDDKEKRRELFDSDNRIIVVRNASDDKPVAFLSFRFIMEDDDDILYIYEIQVSKEAQRKAIGRHLMLLAEEIAKLSNMHYVMLTVQKNNVSAFRFYRERMGYSIDSGSPSLHGDLEASYEILSKFVGSEEDIEAPLV